MIKKQTAAIITVIVIILTATFSSFLTIQITKYINASGGNSIAIPKNEYLKNREFYQKIDLVLEELEENYLYEVDRQDLLDGAITGMVDAVADKYTWYGDPEKTAQWLKDQATNYEGIGVVVQPNEEENTIDIVHVYEGGPAAKAGVAVGDKLIKVEGEPFFAETLDDAISKVKGLAGTPVNITFLRDKDEIELKIIRAVVEIPELEYEMLPNNIGYLRLYDFDGKPGEKFIEAVEDLKKQGMYGLVLDIRGNPGGRLDEYQKIADYLLPEGLLITQINRDGEVTGQLRSDANAFNMPLVLLCNNYTASAGDLLTAAVQDYGVGTIVGETTFGKGIVQTIKQYTTDDALGVLYYTTDEYLTPEGRKIHGIGVTPDIEVPIGNEAEEWLQQNPGEALPKELDQQLQTALEVLNEQIQPEIASE